MADDPTLTKLASEEPDWFLAFSKEVFNSEPDLFLGATVEHVVVTPQSEAILVRFDLGEAFLNTIYLESAKVSKPLVVYDSVNVPGVRFLGDVGEFPDSDDWRPPGFGNLLDGEIGSKGKGKSGTSIPPLDNGTLPLDVFLDMFRGPPDNNDVGDSCDPDIDSDGLFNSIDILPNEFSNEFADVGTTFGTIESATGQFFLLDLDDPQGVLLVVLTGEVSLCTCGVADFCEPILVDASTTITLRCE